MKDKRFFWALLVALISTAFGLLCCIGVFFLLWGNTPMSRLLPWVVFIAALLVSLPICLFAFRKRR